MPQINQGSQPRWDRLERADLFEQYRELRTQGISERQAAKELKGPRTTLPAWRIWHDTLDICPGALVKRGGSTLPAFGTLGTFGACHVPGPLPTDGLPLCSLVQSLASAMCPSIPRS